MEPTPAAKKLKLQNGTTQRSAPVAVPISSRPSDGRVQNGRQPGQHAASAETPKQPAPAAGQQSGKKRKHQVASPEHVVRGVQL